MRVSVAVAALSALLVAAQKNSTFSINPTEVPLPQRASWCQGQTATCDILCEKSSVANSCNPNTLDFSCTCQNGSAPGLQYYTQTIDTYVCQQAYSDCNQANAGNAQGQKNCTDSIANNCGSLNPTDFKGDSSSSSSSSSAPAGTASATAASSSAASASSSAASTTSSKAAAATNYQNIGTGALAAGMGVLAYLL